MKKLFALLTFALLVSQFINNSAQAFGGGNISVSRNFGSCSFALSSYSSAGSAHVALYISSSIYQSGGSEWAGNYIYSKPSISGYRLRNCIPGSISSEFQFTYQNGADGATFAAEDSMGVTFTFRGKTYDYRLTGTTTTTNVIASPSKTDFIAPTVTLGALTATGSGTYTSAITLSEAAGNGTVFDASDLSASNGSVTGFTGSGTSFTATLTPSGTAPISLSVASGVFTDAAGNDNVASGTISKSIPKAVDTKKETRKLINNVVSNNARMVLQNKPRLARRLNRFKAGRMPGTGHLSAYGVSIANSGLPFDARLNRDSGSFSFSLTQARQNQGKAKISVDPFAIIGAVSPETRVDVAHAASFKAPASTEKSENEQKQSHLLGYMPPPSQTVSNPQPASDFIEPLNYDAWIEASYGQQTLGDSKAKFAILHAGMDYLVTSNLLLGFGAQMDWADYDSKSSAANAEGFGFLIGPYMTSKLSDQLYLDARLGWGQSYSDVSPLGTYKDEVTTNRILASFAVIGDFDWHAIKVTPQVRLSYFRDESDAYVDSQGSNIASSLLETGILEFGPAFAKSFELANGLTLTPKLSADGIWTFAENSSNSNITSSSGTGIRARLGAGLNVRTEDNLTLMFNGIYDGIGQSDYEAYSGTIRLSKQW